VYETSFRFIQIRHLYCMMSGELVFLPDTVYVREAHIKAIVVIMLHLKKKQIAFVSSTASIK